MKFSERMQTYASAIAQREERLRNAMKHLARFVLEMYAEDLVDGEAYYWGDFMMPPDFLGKSVPLEEHGVTVHFLSDGKVCVEID